MAKITLSVVIPAYNEEGALADVIDKVRRALEGQVSESEIIVVNDGSTDKTAEIARQAGAVVLSHPVNRGYGQALSTGIQAARHEWILMIDADGSYPAGEISKLFEFAGDFDLVIGARTGSHFWGSSAQTVRRWVYLQLTRFVVGEPVPDANSGLRLVRRSMALNTGPIHCAGYSFTTTMTLSFLHAGRCVKYVPISYEARVGFSKVKPVRDVLRTLQLMTQVLIVYNPLKLFSALMGIPLGAGGVLGLFWLFSDNAGYLIASILCAMAGLQCFLAGAILDSLRLHRREP